MRARKTALISLFVIQVLGSCAPATDAAPSAIYYIKNVFFPKSAHPTQSFEPSAHINEQRKVLWHGNTSTRGIAAQQECSADALVKADLAGNELSILTDEQMNVRSFSVSPDGDRLICYRVGKAPNGRISSELLILSSSGVVSETIPLTDRGLRVLGAPVLLPDHQHIGLSVCEVKVVNIAADQPDPERAKTPSEFAQRQGQIAEAGWAWAAGTIPSDPFIATMDLKGENLNKIAPGAMPSWSPDGQTILYTDFASSGSEGPKGPSQICEVSADGRGAHPVGPKNSCFGTFSPNGKQIAFIGVDGVASGLFIANPDGTNANEITHVPSFYGLPQWIGHENSLQILRMIEPQQTMAHIAPPDDGKQDSVWMINSNGSALRRSSPLQSRCVIDVDAERLLINMLFLNSHAATATTQAVANKPRTAAEIEKSRAIAQQALDEIKDIDSPQPIGRRGFIEAHGKGDSNLRSAMTNLEDAAQKLVDSPDNEHARLVYAEIDEIKNATDAIPQESRNGQFNTSAANIVGEILRRLDKVRELLKADPAMSDLKPAKQRDIKPLPHIETFGSLIYTRDADGKRIPLPDGDYQLPNGAIIIVRDGHGIMPSN